MNERIRVDQQTCAKAPRVDLERLRERDICGMGGKTAVWQRVYRYELEALLAVVDAAREYADGASLDVLGAALEPFTPPADPMANWDRAWEEVDRWNAEQERDLAVRAAVDATRGNPRDRARDQLADAGVAVQRQFRSDQERIAELEAAAEAKVRQLLDELERAERERDEARVVVDAARAYVELTRRSPHGVTHPCEWARVAHAVAAVDGAKP